jgi:hypothetical protein
MSTSTAKFAQPTCKICILLKKDADLYQQIHHAMIVDRTSPTMIARWANQKLEILNASLPENERIAPLNLQNFGTHFKSHVSEPQRVKMLLEEKLFADAELRYSGMSKEDSKAIDNYMLTAREELTDYTKLTRMVGTLEDRLWTYDEYLNNKDLNNENMKPNLTEIANYRTQVESLLSLKVQLSKLRNSSAVSGMAVRASVELCIQAFLDKLLLAAEDAKQTILAEMPGSSLPDDVFGGLRNQIGESMKSVIPEIIERVCKDYNIK